MEGVRLNLQFAEFLVGNLLAGCVATAIESKPSTNGALHAEPPLWHQGGLFARWRGYDRSVRQLGLVEAGNDQFGVSDGDSIGEQRVDVVGACE